MVGFRLILVSSRYRSQKRISVSSNLIRRSLAKRRKDEDLSCLALAKQIKISSNQLAALESGRDLPSLWTLKKLATFFDWSPEEIGEYVLRSSPERVGPKRLRKEIR